MIAKFTYFCLLYHRLIAAEALLAKRTRKNKTAIAIMTVETFNRIRENPGRALKAANSMDVPKINIAIVASARSR